MRSLVKSTEAKLEGALTIKIRLPQLFLPPPLASGFMFCSVKKGRGTNEILTVKNTWKV